MRYYYFHDGERQSGPFEISEIKQHILKPDVAVWYADLEYWVWANQVEELKDFIRKEEEPKIKQPPLFNKAKIERDSGSLLGKRQLKLIGFAVLFIAIFVATLSFITNVTKKTGVRYDTVNHTAVGNIEKYNKKIVLKTTMGKGSIVSDKKDKEAQKEKERAKTSEKRDASKFLVLKAATKSNLWGNKMSVTATITNTARFTKYKDVLIEISYYNQHKESVGTSKEVAYVEINPGTSVDVSLKTNMPPGGKTADCRILTAIHFY